jgi:two-component system, OmpR family, response regulator
MTTVTKRVLIVDDDPRIVQLLTEHFKQTYTVETAMSGGEALSIVRRARPDVVVLDVMLPGMSGIHVLKELKRTDPTIPVIVVTGTDSLAIANEAARSGATTYLRKPFDLRELDQRVAEIIANADSA